MISAASAADAALTHHASAKSVCALVLPLLAVDAEF